MGGVIYSIHSWDPPSTEPLNNPNRRAPLSNDAYFGSVKRPYPTCPPASHKEDAIHEEGNFRTRSIGILIDIRVILGNGPGLARTGT